MKTKDILKCHDSLLQLQWLPGIFQNLARYFQLYVRKNNFEMANMYSQILKNRKKWLAGRIQKFPNSLLWFRHILFNINKISSSTLTGLTLILLYIHPITWIGKQKTKTLTLFLFHIHPTPWIWTIVMPLLLVPCLGDCSLHGS